MKKCIACAMQSDRRGFVLLYVLFVLLIAVLIAAGLARRTLALTLEAATAEEELQHRWAREGLRRSLLPRAEEILKAEGGQTEGGIPAPRSVTATVILSGHQFSVIVADEDAKANLNTIHRHQGGAAATAVVRDLSSLRLPVRLRPFEPNASGERIAIFDSWGQVFDLPADRDSGRTIDIARATDQLTCWGSGRLNLRRATDAAVEAVCQDRVSSAAVEAVLAARRKHQTRDLDGLVDRLGLRERDRRELGMILATESTCHSLWILPVGRGVSAGSELHLLERSAGRSFVATFVW